MLNCNEIQKIQDICQLMLKNQQYRTVFSKAEKKYEIKNFKYQTFSPTLVPTIYQDLQKRYQLGKLTPRTHKWYQNQRKIFLWFAIGYQYFYGVLMENYNQEKMLLFSSIFFNKDPSFLEYQCRIIFRITNRKKWAGQEDQMLTSLVKQLKQKNRKYPIGNWNDIAKEIFFDSKKRYFRTPKQCRQRWFNHLDIQKIKGQWSPKQDFIIVTYVKETGKKWANIVSLLNHKRTEHMIKNRYKTILSKFFQKNTDCKFEDMERIMKYLQSEYQVLRLRQSDREFIQQNDQETNKSLSLQKKNQNTFVFTPMYQLRPNIIVQNNLLQQKSLKIQKNNYIIQMMQIKQSETIQNNQSIIN